MRKRTFPSLLTLQVADKILEGVSPVSLDLGLTEVDLTISKDRVKLPDGNVIFVKDLEKIAHARNNVVHFLEKGIVYQVAIFDGHFYKLVPTSNAPTLEIDGIRMHRTKNTTPILDAIEKVEAIKIRGGRVLDTCSGLGYTAIKSLENDVDLVVSIEVKPSVLRIASINPWSNALFTDKRVNLLIGDVFTLVDFFPNDFFSHIIHDPPRLTHSGRLYGREFYCKLFRILSAGGNMFHYTGEPGSKFRRLHINKGVARRLRLSGFKNTKYIKKIFGITCEKPSSPIA
jgi:predicted methyltransferase